MILGHYHVLFTRFPKYGRMLLRKAQKQGNVAPHQAIFQLCIDTVQTNQIAAKHAGTDYVSS